MQVFECAAIKIKEGGHNSELNTEHSLAKITPAPQARWMAIYTVDSIIC